MPQTKRRFPYRLTALVGGIGLIVLGFSAINLTPDLSHLEIDVLSGARQGNYHALTERLARAATVEGGQIENIPSQGSVENLQRLTSGCDAQFALVQDGVPAPEDGALELIGHLPKSESVFVIGRDAARLTQFEQIRGLRVGVGPANSGTDHLARQVFSGGDLGELGLVLSNHALTDQLRLLQTGQLDLGVFVLDEDAELIRNAVREQGLQLARFEHLDVVARRFPFVWHGRIGAGQFDPIRVLPEEDVRVLRVDTLVVGNGCASRAETVGLLTLLSHEFPNFVAHNRENAGSSLFPLSADARRFYANDGPEWADSHVPWLVNIMPLGNWFYVVMSISVLFNLMTTWHRFRLWRVDANRDKLQEVFRDIFGSERTPEEIGELEPTRKHTDESTIARIDDTLRRMDALRETCREHENSMLVPMGQEGAYRYQEEQMELVLTSVRAFRQKLDRRIADGELVLAIDPRKN